MTNREAALLAFRAHSLAAEYRDPYTASLGQAALASVAEAMSDLVDSLCTLDARSRAKVLRACRLVGVRLWL